MSVVLPVSPNPNTKNSTFAMAKLRLASRRNSMIGSFSRISQVTVDPSDDPDRQHPADKRAPEPVFDLTAIQGHFQGPRRQGSGSE